MAVERESRRSTTGHVNHGWGRSGTHLMKNPFDIITFDCYGTLIDWESGIVSAFQSEAARDGLTLDRDKIVAAYMVEEPSVELEGYRSYREVLAETAGCVARRCGWKLELPRRRFLAESLPRWPVFTDANPALERLARRFQLGILSNVDDDLLEATLRHFTVRFDLIVTAAQVRSYKPAPAHFLEALRRASGGHLLHAAQSYFHDIVPCRNLRIPVIWINRKAEPAATAGQRPTEELPDLTALADLLGV